MFAPWCFDVLKNLTIIYFLKSVFDKTFFPPNMIGFQYKMAKAILHIMSVKNKARKALLENIEMRVNKL